MFVCDVVVYDLCDKLIVFGFIDMYIYYLQMDMIVLLVLGLLLWFDKYMFLIECQFGDFEYVCEVVDFFVDELFVCGMMSVFVYCMVYK